MFSVISSFSLGRDSKKKKESKKQAEGNSPIMLFVPEEK
jgi:hypothetical protein